MNQQSAIFDTVVIGGGINGTGIAADAAGRGLSVALCEQNDLASATSSASSKLIHGGLRYLETYEFSLVRKALKESELLLHLAPHLIAPLSIHIPHLSHHRPWLMIRAGLFLYNHLAARPSYAPARSVTFDQNCPLKNQLRKGFSFSDGQVDDARLVILNARQAQLDSAQILARHKCTAITAENEFWRIVLKNSLTGEERELKSRTVVNATGPWVSRLVTDLIESPPRHTVQLIKGSHIVVPRLKGQNHAYLLQNEDGRVVFVLPYLDDYTLIGTTEEEFAGDLSEVTISKQETDYLISIVNRYFKQQIDRQSIVHSFAGIRPLMDESQTSATRASRDYQLEFEETPLPLLSIYGGKVTTYRLLAEHAVDKLKAHIAIDKPSNTRNVKLPGADFESLESLSNKLAGLYPWLPAVLIARWVQSYGSLCLEILEGVTSLDALGVDFGHSLYQFEVDYLVRCEWAVTVEDILWRRTKLGLKFTTAETRKLAAYLPGTH